MTEEELFQLNKKKFAEQLKQELLASKKAKPAKKASDEAQEGRNSIVKLNAEEGQE
jgi:regulator of replication initiation timing